MGVPTTAFPLRRLERSLAAHPQKTPLRHIPVQAGRALEILGHAIDYLTDEYLHETKQISSHDPQLQAVQILMALNRQIYYACPVQRTFTEKLLAFFHRASR